jgi:hypothetical protein
MCGKEVFEMKKVFGLIAIAIMMLSSFGLVLAEDEVVDEVMPEAEEGATGDSGWDRFRFAFTFNKEKKINRALDMAEKNLLAAEANMEDDPEAYAAAQERYDELLAKAEEILADIEDKSGNEKQSNRTLKKIARIQNRFELHRDHIDTVYARQLDRFEANNASDEKIERFEMFYERAVNRSYRVEERVIERRQNAANQLRTMRQMSDEELEELLENIEEGEGIVAAREARFERAEERVEKVTELKLGRIEKAYERLDNSENLTDEQKAEIEERLERAENRIMLLSERHYERLDKLENRSDAQIERLQNWAEKRLEGISHEPGNKTGNGYNRTEGAPGRLPKINNSIVNSTE